MTMSTVYKPPGGDVDNFIKGLKKLYKKKRENWIIGDFNINFMNNKSPDTEKNQGFLLGLLATMAFQHGHETKRR